MRNKLATLVTIGALALAGCSKVNQHYDPDYASKRNSEWNRNEGLQELKTKINKIAVYQTFNNKRTMSYGDFVKITGINHDLSSEFDSSPLWIEVTSDSACYSSKQSVYDGRVRIDMPHDLAVEALLKLDPPKKTDYIDGFP